MLVTLGKSRKQAFSFYADPQAAERICILH